MPEITIAMGIMGGISVVTMKLISDQANNEAFLKANTEINKTVSVIQTALNNPESCKLMLKGKGAGDAINELKLSGTRKNGVTFEQHFLQDETITGANKKIYNGFKVYSNNIQLQASSMGMSTVMDLVIKFNISKRNKAISDIISEKESEVLKRIPLIVTMDPMTNKISSCGPAVSDTNDDARKKFCLSMGGVATWDDGTKVCRLKSMDCPWGQVPTQMTSLGGVRCAPIDTIIGPEKFFNDSSSTPCPVTGAGIKIVRDTNGKLSLKCN